METSKRARNAEQVQPGWRAASDILTAKGHVDLAVQVRRFVEQGYWRSLQRLTKGEQRKRSLRGWRRNG